MRKVHFSWLAEETLGSYYEEYKDLIYDNDLKTRVLHYRRMKEFLFSFDFADSYEINGNKYVDIDDFCTVHFIVRANEIDVYVENIYLNYE